MKNKGSFFMEEVNDIPKYECEVRCVICGTKLCFCQEDCETSSKKFFKKGQRVEGHYNSPEGVFCMHCRDAMKDESFRALCG